MELLAMARSLLERATPETEGLWPRAAALLARQALEENVRAHWRGDMQEVSSLSMRAQLICLRMTLEPPSTAVEVAHAWAALSRACHHHPFELAPGVGELTGWLSAVERFVENA